MLYLRYIDDVFGIWLGSVESLQAFHSVANSIHPNIKVDLRYSETKIEFLDVLVGLNNGYVKTDLFSKPTDSKTYLHFSSDHPSHTKKAVPMGLALRMKRICSDPDDYNRHKQELKDRLVERGYPDDLIEGGFKRADDTERDNLLGGNTRKSKTIDRVPLVITYSNYLPSIRKVLKDKKHLLRHSEHLSDIFKRDSLVSYRRGRNLKDMLVHAKTKRLLRGERGPQNCGKNCVICRRMFSESALIQGPSKSSCTFDRTIGCKSFNVIYGVYCKVCHCLCYVGETGGALYARLANHLSTIRTNSSAMEFPVAGHFNSTGHSLDDILFVGLERVWKKEVIYRRLRERRWIDLLGTSRQQGGLNIKLKI